MGRTTAATTRTRNSAVSHMSVSVSMWSLRRHFTNKSVTGAPYRIKVQSVTRLDTMVKSTMTETVPSRGRGGTAAAMTQNEQTTQEHSISHHRIIHRVAQKVAQVKITISMATTQDRMKQISPKMFLDPQRQGALLIGIHKHTHARTHARTHAHTHTHV